MNSISCRKLTIFWSGVSPDGVELDEDVGDGAEEVAQHHHHRQLHRLDLGVRYRPANRERERERLSKRKKIALREKLIGKWEWGKRTALDSSLTLMHKQLFNLLRF